MAYGDRRRNAASRIQGINLSSDALNGIPSRGAVNSTPQGQQIYGSGAGNAGFTPSNALLPPDQNPAYQAAISRNPTPASMRAGGSGSGAYSWITTPSGGQMRVPTGSVGALLNTGSLRGSQVTQIGNQAPIDYAAEKAKGFGEPTPSVQNFTGGPALVQGGVANPIENLSSAQRGQYGVGGFLDSLRSSPVSLALGVNNLIPDNISPIGIGQGLVNAASRIGQGVANFFGGTPANAAPAPSPDALPAPSASPTPIQTPVPTATPSPTAPQVSNTDQQPPMTTDYQLPAAPRRYSDYY